MVATSKIVGQALRLPKQKKRQAERLTYNFNG